MSRFRQLLLWCFVVSAIITSASYLLLDLTHKDDVDQAWDVTAETTTVAFQVHTDERSNTAECSQNRVSMIQDTCIRNGWQGDVTATKWRTPRTYNRILVDDFHRLLYCVIPKVGCSSLKSLFVTSSPFFDRNYTGKLRVHSPMFLRRYRLRYLSTYPMSAIEEKLATYRSFMVVRHPFDRLRSAYVDKIMGDALMERRRAKILELNPGIAYNSEITFEQFLKTVVGRRLDNIHWLPYYNLCHPCNIRYDRVINLETIDEEFPQILHWLNTSSSLGTRNQKRDQSPQSKLSEVSQYMRQVDDLTTRKLLRMFEKDFQLYGYSWDRREGADVTTYTDCTHSGHEEAQPSNMPT